MAIKIDSTSQYWCDFEGELCVYFHLRWSQKQIANLLNSQENFINEYISLSHFYGIAEARLHANSLLNEEITSLFRSFYLYNGLAKYPSKLFLNTNENGPRKIVTIDPLTELIDKDIGGSIPLRMEFLKYENNFEMLGYIDNDLFFSEIDNKNTKRDKNIGGKNLWLDNSELAYLNTPRFNSFFRDLKALCFEYGATSFELENLGLPDFTEDGILLNGEVVYYEDIEELLEERHRIVSS